MIGCFNHGPFNCRANKTIDSTFFKTKDNEVCNRRIHFVNNFCRYNTFCIILSPPKNFATFVRWKSFERFRQRRLIIEKMWTKKSPKFCSLFPNCYPVNREKYKIICTITINSPSPHTYKQTHLLINHKPAVTHNDRGLFIVLVSLLLTLNIFYNLFEFFYWQLWTCKCRLGTIADWLIKRTILNSFMTI